MASNLLEKVSRRYERFYTLGFPKTVWESECLAKEAKAWSAESQDVKPSDIHRLRIFGPLSFDDPTVPGFFSEECRACTGRFLFRVNTATATILTGKPIDQRYEAISYVWGDARSLLIFCKCGMKKSIPISSSNRFCALLALAASVGVSYDGVWLDALSIDQDSKADKKRLINAMGEIFKNAESVLVLLPSADKFLYDCLLDLRDNVMIQDRMGLSNPETQPCNKTFGTSDSDVLNHFVSALERFKQNLHHSIYFGRAWTFQEWALACDLHVTCEGEGLQADNTSLIPQVKASVIRAAVRLAIHRLLLGAYAIPFKIRNADLPAWMNDVKVLFPQEDIFCSSEDIDWEERLMDIEVPQTGVNSALGLRLLGKHSSLI